MFDPKAQDLFWSKADKSGGPDSCWPWTGSTQTDRGRTRGMFYIEGKSKLAHRLAAQIAHGEQPGQVCMHACDNPICVNPAHLSWGTQIQNMRDCSIRKRASGQDKTHCLRGHALTADNLINRANGRRLCRTCNAERQVEARRRAKMENNHAA